MITGNVSQINIRNLWVGLGTEIYGMQAKPLEKGTNEQIGKGNTYRTVQTLSFFLKIEDPDSHELWI